MMFDAVPTMSEHIRAGKVKAMGTTGTARSAVLPDVPTIGQAGVPKYEDGRPMHYGTTPALVGTPEEYIKALGPTSTKVLAMKPGDILEF